MDMEALERLMEAEELDEKRQQYFPALGHRREKGPFRGKQKALVGAPRREGSFARKLAK